MLMSATRYFQFTLFTTHHWLIIKITFLLKTSNYSHGKIRNLVTLITCGLFPDTQKAVAAALLVMMVMQMFSGVAVYVGLQKV